MPIETSYPFIRVSKDKIRLDPWKLKRETSDAETLHQDHIEDWDYQMDLDLYRDISIDAKDLREECRLNDDDVIAVASDWKCTGTDIRGSGTRKKIGNRNEQTERLSLHLPGDHLSESVELSIRIFLCENSGEASPLAAEIPGSVLWETTKTLNLEGVGERFPVEPLDFEESPYPNDAAWYLEWNRHNLEGDIRGPNFRLFINTSRENIFEALTSGSEDESDQIIRSIMLYDIAQKLIQGVVRNEEISEENRTDFPRNSIGRTVLHLIHTHFSQSLADLKELKKDRPEKFDAELQDALEFLKSETK